MEEMYEIILREGYGLKLYSAVRTRTCLICTTDSGIFDLKKNIYDESIINFEGMAKNSLIKNGFNYTVPFIETEEGGMFFAYNDNRFTLEKHRVLRQAENENGFDYIKAAQTLAKMHNAAYMDSFVCDRKNYGRLETLYEKRIAEFKHIRKRIKRDELYDDADMVIKKYYDYYIERALNALEMVKESDYYTLSIKAEEKKTFCHNSFKSDNIKIDDLTEDMYVDNFGKAAYDICLADLAYYIRRIIKREGTDGNTVMEVMKSYSSIREISGKERMLIKAMVVFPWKFMNLCNEYYNKRKAFTFGASVQRIERCTYSIEKENAVINIL